MSKAKRIFIFGSLLLIIIAMVAGPLMDTIQSKETETTEILANFTDNSNFELKHGQKKIIRISHQSLKASKLQLFLDDSLVQTWNHPQKSIQYSINTGKLKVGAKELRLVVYKGGSIVSEDSRLLVVLSDVTPKNVKASVINLYPHNQGHFTQGFEFDGNTLYEGTGQNGSSLVAKIDLKTGNPIVETNLEPAYFGEGITILGNNVYQITWQQQKCFVYNKATLEKVSEISYNGEGWGLSNNGSQLIMTDGSERLYFRNPQTFEIIKTVEVYDNKGPITNLNELEFINGKLYANVWQQNYIVVVDPNTGKVIQKIDCTDVVTKARGTGEVLNGIAYQKSTGKLFLTGKNWSNTAEVNLK